MYLNCKNTTALQTSTTSTTEELTLKPYSENEEGFKLTIFSTGKATEENSAIGGGLGQYDYVPQFGYWLQTTRLNGQDDGQVTRRYVYKHSDSVYGLVSDQGGVWFHKMGQQWFYSSGVGVLEVDNTLLINHEPLNTTCNSYLVTSYGASYERFNDSFGVFNMTDNWLYGRPVYSNEVGQLLYVCNYGQWCIGPKIGRYGIRSSDKPMFPASATGWVFWNGSSPEKADIEVQCDAEGGRNVIPVWDWRDVPKVPENSRQQQSRKDLEESILRQAKNIFRQVKNLYPTV